MNIYHGGYCKVKEPIIKISKFTKDFGTGFYCTELKEQAKRWAIKFDTPIISSYEYQEDNSLNVLKFDEMSEQWLDFIIDCRNGKQHNYDIVIGAMADDQVYNFINDFVTGIISRAAFWELAKFRYPTHQIVFCTEKSLQCILFIESEEVKADGRIQRAKRRK